MKDQEGMIPWEQQLTKQITEYTQWESDETREIKGLGPRGPSEAFRGERLHPGSPLTHSCFQAPVLTQQQSHFCLRKPQQGKAGSKKPLIGVANEWPCELQMPPAGWGMLFLFSLLWPINWWPCFQGFSPGIVGLLASPSALGAELSLCLFASILRPVSHVLTSLSSLNASIRVPLPQNQLGDWATNLIIQ